MNKFWDMVNMIKTSKPIGSVSIMDRIAKEVYFYEGHEMSTEDCEQLCKKINRILNYYETD